MDTSELSKAVLKAYAIADTLEDANMFIAELRETNDMLRTRGDDWKQSAHAAQRENAQLWEVISLRDRFIRGW